MEPVLLSLPVVANKSACRLVAENINEILKYTNGKVVHSETHVGGFLSGLESRSFTFTNYFRKLIFADKVENIFLLVCSWRSVTIKFVRN